MSANSPRIFYLLHRAHAALFRSADQALRATIGLTTTQQAVLFVLREENDLPITAIAERLRMGKSSLTGLVDRMADQELVNRTPSSDDGRSILITLTKKGEALSEQSAKPLKDINKDLLDGFSNEEQAIITRFLNHVADGAGTIVNAHLQPKNANQANTHQE